MICLKWLWANVWKNNEWSSSGLQGHLQTMRPWRTMRPRVVSEKRIHSLCAVRHQVRINSVRCVIKCELTQKQWHRKQKQKTGFLLSIIAILTRHMFWHTFMCKKLVRLRPTSNCQPVDRSHTAHRSKSLSQVLKGSSCLCAVRGRQLCHNLLTKKDPTN